jgi:NOL1/NOP2/fmu family ribosome biogenesis protein
MHEHTNSIRIELSQERFERYSNGNMANDSDDELATEKILIEKDKKLFLNHIDCYHGKNIARVGFDTKRHRRRL